MVFELNWKHFSIGLCHGLRRETEDTAGLLTEWQRHSAVTESPWGTGMKPGSRDEAAESHISEKFLSAFVGGHEVRRTMTIVANMESGQTDIHASH